MCVNNIKTEVPDYSIELIYIISILVWGKKLYNPFKRGFA